MPLSRTLVRWSWAHRSGLLVEWRKKTPELVSLIGCSVCKSVDLFPLLFCVVLDNFFSIFTHKIRHYYLAKPCVFLVYLSISRDLVDIATCLISFTLFFVVFSYLLARLYCFQTKLLFWEGHKYIAISKGLQDKKLIQCFYSVESICFQNQCNKIRTSRSFHGRPGYGYGHRRAEFTLIAHE